MSDGFTVILGDLRAMTTHFEREHEEYLQVTARLTPARAATGDGHLDQTLGASVSGSLIGGDLPGLNTLASTLATAPQEMSGVVHALSADVEGLVSATGWSGGAADNFRRAWTADAMAGGLLSELVKGVAETVSLLVETLEILERALREQARLARLAAERDLAAILDSLLEEPRGAAPDLYVTTADYLRTLLAIPNESNLNALATYQKRMADLRDARIRAKADLAGARAAGADIRPGDPGYAPYREAIDAIKKLDQDTAAARTADGGPAWSKILNYKIGDLKGVSALTDAGKLPKFLEFTKEIPVIDIVATGAAATLQTKDDVEKGWSFPHAAAADFGAGASGIP